ncbi:hypothetical protein Ae406Ps2_5993c [Pseudonocardia sp. Ae406_Ps2]|uniref:hypothetical protein n=1 Tax=unclassified Pseudonocardia TaxID=2619320 RepID=UPI00094B7172|nr:MULTISPECIES: hypothetical protein [unclassified Pseudonocardia]OLL89631.1 hypothetical protein Ae331Ps2_5965 [Pseudonocardia sp. Ae331_Ps2]OLL96159.1 hypothetical protein Ae406Ps2_5993c [Pseudonocardia sp. Ae406_Ps2]OLM08661.1 hypothetical protein Ae505Ps2_6048c [Pseudonocardia sp. Ae505_Ps2]OLM08685.1 hypothetical protein Ae505Ps2_6072c [Pseudonocardia sp. Ae505_Ps2]
MRYFVTARRWERGWELHIADEHGAEVGVTQSRTLGGAEAMVRDYLALDDRDAAAPVEIRPVFDSAVQERITASRARTRAAQLEQEAAAKESRAAVALLDDLGLSGTEIARVLQLSRSRVSDLRKASR